MLLTFNLKLLPNRSHVHVSDDYDDDDDDVCVCVLCVYFTLLSICHLHRLYNITTSIRTPILTIER